MRVIQKSADAELIETVHRLRNMPLSWTGLHLPVSKWGIAIAGEAREAILQRFGAMLEENGSSHKYEGIFLCHDGDIIVLCYQRSGDAIVKSIHALLAQLLPGHAEGGVSRYTIYPLTERYEELFFLAACKQHDSSDAKALQAKSYAKPTAAFELACQKRKMRSTPLILVVDDDTFSLSMLRAALKSQYQVVTAENGMDALQIYSREAPDMVFLDIELPDISGHKVVTALINADPQAFIVMLSAHSQMNNVHHAVQEGAKGFIAKPLSKEKIESYIQICLSERTTRQSHG